MHLCRVFKKDFGCKGEKLHFFCGIFFHYLTASLVLPGTTNILILILHEGLILALN